MTKSTITREQLLEIIETDHVQCGEASYLARMALAAIDSEPVAWIAIYHGEVYDEAIGITRSVVEAQADHFGWESALTEIIPLYRHAQPAPERDQVRQEHAEWSQATFGNVGPVGPLKHLSKEALEAAAEPSDLFEWADMHFLLWDAQRRAGITDEQITQAMIEKLAVNKLREWPEPKDGEPRLHIKEKPAQVVPDDVQRDAKRWRALLGSARIRILGSAGFDATAHPGENPDYRHFGMEIWTHYPNWLHEKNEYGIDTLTQYADAMLAAAPQSPGSEPSTVPGKWIPVSERMPEDSGRYWCYVEEQNDLGKSHYQWNCSWNGDRWWVESEGGGIVTHWMPLPAAPQEVKGE